MSGLEPYSFWRQGSVDQDYAPSPDDGILIC